MQLANQEAQRFNHEYIGSEHILLGLIDEGSGVAADVLKNLGIGLRRIRLETEKLVQNGHALVTMGKLPQTPRAKKIIEFSMEEARHLHDNYVGTEHLLLGLLRDQEGVVAAILANLGLDVMKVAAEISKIPARGNDPERGRFPRSLQKSIRPAEQHPAIVVELPNVCPKCGQAQVIRVLWHLDRLSGKNREDVAARKAILGSRSFGQGPPWVCLQCEPRWSDVHRLALQEVELEAAKENAVGSQDFDLAARHRDAQMALRGRLDSLIGELLGNQ